MLVTMPSGTPARSSVGPCSMWSSRNADGTSSYRQSARLPMQPTSSPRNAATEPQPVCSTASIAATTPSAPSNLPPCGTESRCDPTHTSSRWPERPSRLPCASTSTARPASRSQPAVSLCAASSSGLGCGRFAPSPPPIAYSSSRRSNTRSIEVAVAATSEKPTSPWGTKVPSSHASEGRASCPCQVCADSVPLRARTGWRAWRRCPR